MFFKNLKKFSFIAMIALIAVLLVGCVKDKPEDLLAEAKTKILVDASITNLKSDINLQNKAIVKDSKGEDIEIDIVWTITASDFFAIEVDEDGKVMGKVTRPVAGSEQPEVTLTATLTYMKKTTDRQWTVYIAPLPESEAFTIRDAIDQPVDTIVTVEGIVTYIMAGKGFFLKDETASIYVFTNGAVDAGVKTGAKVKATGKKIVYYDLYEIKEPTYEVVTAAPVGGYDYESEAIEISVKEADAKAFSGASSIANYGVVYKITGVVEEMQDGDYKNLYLVGAKDGKKIQIYSSTVSEAKDEIKALLGKTIEVTALVFDHHSGGYWRILPYAGTAKEVESVELTNQEKVDRVIVELGNMYKENQEVLGNLTLVTENALDEAITISWASSNEAVIGVGGIFTAPTADANVTLTATVKLGDIEETFEVTVIGKMKVEVITVLAAIGKEENTLVAIEGHVSYVMSGKGFFVNDGTASIYAYVDGAVPANIKPGAKVKVIGNKKTNYDLAQIITPVSSVLTEAPAEYDYASKAVEATIEEIDAKAFAGTASIPNYGVIYKFSGVVELRGSYDDVVIVDPISGKYLYTYYKADSGAMAELTSLVGKNVEVTALVYDHHSGGYWRVLPYGGSVSEVAGAELTDLDKVAAAKAALEAMFVVDQEVKTDLVLPVANELYDGLTISWLSSNEAIIANDGTFVSPSENTAVTLTATITLNDATATFSVNVLAKYIDLTPGANLFFSEYVEGTGNNKAMEIYNNSGTDIDLDGYFVELYANGNETLSSYNPPIALTGILKAGETFVIVTNNAKADQGLKDKADLFSGSINHNGDDVYLLKKNDEILDSFGQFGVDPGDFYGSAEGPNTKDMTWVRKPSVTTGDKIIDDVFDPTVEWVATSENDYTGLGSHTID